MNWNIRKRLAVIGAIAAVTAVLVPAGLAAGEEPIAGGETSVVLLTLGNSDNVTWVDLTQGISTKKNDCTAVSFASNPSLLSVTAIGGSLGEVKDGLGVRSANDGSGEPCGRVEADDGEAISVALGSALGDHLMTAVDVDLELKFNATVAVSYRFGGVEVDSDTFNPMGGSDDGPDSADGDNYRYFNRPEALFDEVVFTAAAGAFSLEGGADGTDDGSLAENNSSQFEVVESFDGEITCADEVTISDTDVPGVVGEVTMHAMQFDPEGPDGFAWYVQDCLLKLYNAEVTADSLFFIPELEDTSARYTIEITAENQPITVDGEGRITSLIMLYDPEGDSEPTRPLLACEGQPIVDPGAEGYADFWTQADAGLLPNGESACFYDVSVTPSGEGVGTEVWDIYFEDDPGFSFR